jgi:hypothetical protein
MKNNNEEIENFTNMLEEMTEDFANQEGIQATKNKSLIEVIFNDHDLLVSFSVFVVKTLSHVVYNPEEIKVNGNPLISKTNS